MNMFSSKPKFIPGVPYEVQRIYDMLNPRPKELLHGASGRTFIGEGEVGVFNHKERLTKRRYLFLFNDLLLVTKKDGKKSHQLKIFISLRSSLKIEDVLDSATRHKVEFRIYAPKKTIILFTETNEEKVRWLRDIRACVDGVAESEHAEYGETRAPSSPYDPTPAYTSSPSADLTIVEDVEPEKEKISGDIGKIEIPGFESDNTFGTIPGENEHSSEEEGGVVTAVTATAGVSILDNSSQPLPPTPHSTPVSPSVLEADFDSLVNRKAQTQETVIDQGASIDFFAQPQNPSSTIAAQPFANSSPLAPTAISPSASVLQPTPANATPSFMNSTPLAPLQPTTSSKMEGFAALKSLDTNQGAPQQFNFSQGLSVDEQMRQLSMQSPYYNGN